MIKAVLLAGGKGERLRPFTLTTPKPLLTIGKKTLLEYNLRHLKKFGINEVIITLGYRGELIKKYLRERHNFGLKVSYVEENSENPLGTAGVFYKLKKCLPDTFLVVYSDILRILDLEDVINFHRTKKAHATICVYKNRKINPKSSVVFDKKNAMISFTERPKAVEMNKTVWSNASLYIFEPGVLRFWSKLEKKDFGQDVIPQLLKKKLAVYAYVQKGYFQDIGSYKKFKIAKKDLEKGKFICY